MNPYHLVVMGVSYGGLNALSHILSRLPKNFEIPIVIVQHMGESPSGMLSDLLGRESKNTVKEAEQREVIKKSTIYIAPPSYHLLIEDGAIFSFSDEPKVNFSRPSIDVLFESAADVFRNHLIGVVLTGANSDGAQGLKCIKELGGLIVVQDPKTAVADAMPRAAIAATQVDHVLDLTGIADFLVSLNMITEVKGFE